MRSLLEAHLQRIEHGPAGSRDSALPVHQKTPS
jgi:hypothetical protein